MVDKFSLRQVGGPSRTRFSPFAIAWRQCCRWSTLVEVLPRGSAGLAAGSMRPTAIALPLTRC